MILNLMDRKDILHMNIAIINQNGGKYLFEVPESISLKEGEKVKCDTKRGVTDGTVWADSITADEPAAKLIGKLLGAKFPLKSVVGKMEYQPFEKPEDKREPEYYSGKVVCVEATDRSVTLGKVYTVEKGVFTWNNGKKSDTKATTIEQFNNWFIAAKFIEFKGE